MKIYFTKNITFNKIINFFLIFFLFVNCQSDKDADVKLEILNNEILSINIDSVDLKRKYSNNEERILALNILKYRLTNNSNKKLLFIIDFENLNVDNSFYFNVVDSVNLKKSLVMPIVNFTDEAVPYLNLLNYQDSIKTSNYLKLGIKKGNLEKYLKYINYSFVLNPKESKTIESFISMPIIDELNLTTASYPVYYENLVDGDRLFLTYNMNFSDYKNILQKWQIDELQENNIEFFEGTIISNSLPIKVLRANTQ
ncbi:hypothetical protein [Flavobacterium sp.]|uniref:hypothetical protein n=1 Tax=Flavobacterium sp. TaxID=239 RepID=UPI002FD99403